MWVCLRDGSAQTIYVLPHWDRSCRSNFLPHPVTLYWQRADQSECWSCACQDSHRSANFQVTGLSRPRTIPTAQTGINPLIVRSRGGRLNHSANETVCLTFRQHANISRLRICPDNYTCCHTAMEVTDQTCHLTHWESTDTGPISPGSQRVTSSAW